MPDRVGESGSGHQLGIKVSLDAVGGQNCGGLPGKRHALIAAVVCDRHGLGFSFRVLQQIIGKALRGLTHGINIHAIGARADHAAKASGAKFEITVKPVVDLFRLILDSKQLLCEILVVQRLLEPSFIFRHTESSLSINR